MYLLFPVQMFHPDRLQGYLNPEPHRWLEWVSVSALLVMAGHWSGAPVCRSWRRMVISTMIVMCALELIGRQTFLQLLPLYNLVRTNRTS